MHSVLVACRLASLRREVTRRFSKWGSHALLKLAPAEFTTARGAGVVSTLPSPHRFYRPHQKLDHRGRSTKVRGAGNWWREGKEGGLDGGYRGAQASARTTRPKEAAVRPDGSRFLGTAGGRERRV